MAKWISACAADTIENEGVVRFDQGARTLAIYRSAADTYHCTDGLCTHESVHLADGLVMGHRIECPKHSGEFDIRTGEAVRSPACRNLRCYPARVEGGVVFVEV